MRTETRISGPEPLGWFKSSYSSDEGDACVEVAASPRTIHVRDSKLGAQAPRVDVPATSWAAFTRFLVGA
ncbi:DUF397 domain-containing protein [Streptomyces sp. NPDC049555]|uniref:DUF397 domain-containing protein n=1 Tax=Streptomyces sp. NPDC049555 TaxID=3154930 RepID=UPI0034135BE9